MNPDLEQALIERLEIEKPATVLFIAPEISPGLTDYLAAKKELKLDHIVFENLEQSVVPLGRFDFAIVADTLEKLERKESEQLISRLRDMHSKLLWVMVSEIQEDSYSKNDAIAQGMRMVNPENFGAGQSEWYEFSLRFYKPVPQWLNAENWANPERWDKSRW